MPRCRGAAVLRPARARHDAHRQSDACQHACTPALRGQGRQGSVPVGRVVFGNGFPSLLRRAPLSNPHRTRALGLAMTVPCWQAAKGCGDRAGEGDLDSPGRIWREVIVKLEGLVREGLGGVQQEGGGPRRALEPALTVRHAVTKETERRCGEPGSAGAVQQRMPA